ncbi:MAG: hypothetical protein Q9227_005675 [Pyrenula ochraceoflavens]
MRSAYPTTIPTIDISARQATARELAQKCQINGCVGITGHGVPSGLLAEAFDVSKRLFELPLEDKMKAPYSPSAIPHRGHSAPGREKAYTKEELSTNSDALADAKRKIMDFKETFEVGDESNKRMYNI